MDITFKNINFSKLKSMKGIFNDIAIRKFIAFEDIDAPNLEILDDMCLDCRNNLYVNISFKNINFPNLISMKNIYLRLIDTFFFINVSAPKLQSMEDLIDDVYNNVIFENIDISSVTTMKNMIKNEKAGGKFFFKNINASNVLELDGVNYLKGFPKITFENIDFSKLTSMENMFNEEVRYPSQISLINKEILVN